MEKVSMRVVFLLGCVVGGPIGDIDYFCIFPWNFLEYCTKWFNFAKK